MSVSKRIIQIDMAPKIVNELKYLHPLHLPNVHGISCLSWYFFNTSSSPFFAPRERTLRTVEHDGLVVDHVMPFNPIIARSWQLLRIF